MTNNLEIVNRSNKYLKYKHLYPNNTLKSGYNITGEIYLTNTTYKVEATFQHVYRHQDSKSNRELTMEQKLTIVNNKSSGQYQDKSGLY